MGKKVKIAILLYFCSIIVMFVLSWLWLLTAMVLFGIFISLVLILNKIYKRTNVYKNNLCFTNQFVSNAGYRLNQQRCFDIANVGSNPARFGFFYEKTKGLNWSTGTQGLDMDLEIIKYYHSYVKPGGYIILPIVVFSSVSGLLDGPYTSSYAAKFSKILCYHPGMKFDIFKCGLRWLKYPLLYNPKNVLKIIRDVEPDTRISITEQPMMATELVEDAKRWMQGWQKEFNIKNFEAPLRGELLEGRHKSIIMFRALLNFCIERGYKPVMVSLPLSRELCDLFNPKIKEIYVDSFVREFKEYNVPYFDYIYDNKFSDSSLFFNALFMNLRGRKLFTHDVLQRLGLEK